LIASLNILAESAKVEYFVEWFTRDFIDVAENSKSIHGKLAITIVNTGQKNFFE